MKTSKLRIGISGWTYPDWRGEFYPDGLAVKDELAFASQTFNSIEINGTFYKLQRPHTFQKWYKETPEHFQFAIKAPKYITHERRLKDVKAPIANFFASGIFALKEKLGAILWQLPPHLPYDKERIEEFLKLLPNDFNQATKLSQYCSEWMRDRVFVEFKDNHKIFNALEVRHHSFNNPEFIDLMNKYNVAIVVGDTAGRWPLIEAITSSIVYIRLHGDETVYPNGYTKSALSNWSKKISATAEKVNHVFAFCDNDHKIAAPQNAMQLMNLLQVNWSKPTIPMVKKATKSKATANNRAVGKSAGKSRAKNKPLNKIRKVAS